MSIITRNNRRENRKTRHPVAGRWPVTRPESGRVGQSRAESHCIAQGATGGLTASKKTRADTVKTSLNAQWL